MGSGRIVSVIGAVIDVEFPRNDVPKVYDALMIDDNNTTLEVQQQLGDGVVRTIAMGSSEGISRGLAVSNTEAPISVPVGEQTLGRIMDVLGNPIDERGPINETERMPIHRAPPSFDCSRAKRIVGDVLDLNRFCCMASMRSSLVRPSFRAQLFMRLSKVK